MKPNKQKPDFLYIGEALLSWYRQHSRDLPWRENKDPYRIWISEIILQQTQVKQGLQHYLNFIGRFPNVLSLARADTDEVLLYWKGLGYYSRALNLHTAARQIRDEFNGSFPMRYHEILRLKGVGKYTAAAISSICFGERIPAVDGNFYRVFSRLFADGFDVSKPGAFAHFSDLALTIMPLHAAGDFNQAVMDLGSEICRPKKPDCQKCPLSCQCLAFANRRQQDFPVKSKKILVTDLQLHYYFVEYGGTFLIRQRGEDFIWKKLYEFPTAIPVEWQDFTIRSKTVAHKLTHRNLTIRIDHVNVPNEQDFLKFAQSDGFAAVDAEMSHRKSFPKPLENYINQRF